MIRKQGVDWRIQNVPGAESVSKVSLNDPLTDEDIERIRKFFVLIRSILIRLQSEGYVIRDGKIIQSPHDHENRTTHTYSDRKRSVP
jgi:hypothetical protein